MCPGRAPGLRARNRRAGRVGRRSRRALQAGRRDPCCHRRGAGQHRRHPVDAAPPRGKTGRCRDERRRTRNPLRRRLRRGRARAREPRSETLELLAAVVPPEASLANPVDLLGSATAATYASALPAIVADEDVDAVIDLFVAAARGPPPMSPQPRQRAHAGAEKPVVPVVLAAETDAGSFPYPETAAKASVARLSGPSGFAGPQGRSRRWPGSTVPGREWFVPLAAEDDAWLAAPAVRQLLEANGISIVPERSPTAPRSRRRRAQARLPCSREERRGRRAQDRAGRSRARSPRRGGRRLGGEPDRRRGARPADDLGRHRAPDRTRAGPDLRTLVAFGPGGVYAELIGDAGFRIAPLTDVDAEELVTAGKAGRSWQAFGAARPPMSARWPTCSTAFRARGGFARGRELDLNPVRAPRPPCRRRRRGAGAPSRPPTAAEDR